MKHLLLILLSLALVLGTLSSCQSPVGPTAPETDSEDASVGSPPTDTQVSTDDTAQTPPENLPQGGEPMESISCFQNPVLTAKTENAWSGYGFGDPFVMRYNGVYYLYCSTKDGNAGVKCWSSTDLLNWSFEGFCSNDPVTRGAYAPEVYYYNGYFYMYTSPAGNGHYVLRSSSPTKGFKPVTGNMGMSIDGSVFVDNDGEWYFYTAGGGNIQVYNMESPTTMRSGRALRTVSVNGGWTEGSMTVYHDGCYYITYTGNHVLSPSYRILYGVSDRSPLDFAEAEPQNPLLISTTDAVFGIGHSSTVKGPDLDSYYIVYHSLVDMMPNRNMNIDRIWFNGERMEILGPTTDPQPVPELPDVYHYFAPGSSLKGWSLEGSFGAGRSGLSLSAGSMLLSKTPFEGDFTAEYNVTSISEGGQAGAVFAYTDGENFGICLFDPVGQKVIIEITVKGETTRTEVACVGSFGEDTRFDCLQALQIERSGRDYTFYMNDRLLCTLKDSPLAGGSIGYITTGAEASFGFIGGTAAVGGNGGADQYKTVSEQAGLIPATHALENHETVASPEGGRSVSVKDGDTLSYKILAASDGSYDLSVLCHGLSGAGMSMEILVDGKTVGSAAVNPVSDGTATLICRGIPLTEGQHVLSVVCRGSAHVEKLNLHKAASVTAFSLSAPVHSDGEWSLAGEILTLAGGSPYGKRLYGSPNMGDYTAEVTVTPKSVPNCGLLVRVTAPGSPNFMDREPTAEDTQAATDWVKGYFVGLSSEGVIIGKQSYGYRQVAAAEGRFQPHRAYTLKVVCEGARLRVYVDGTLYLDYTDPEPFTRGLVGVRAHNCPAVFEGLSVEPVA